MPRLKPTLLVLSLLNAVIPTNALAMGLLVGILGAPPGMTYGPWSKGGNPAPTTESQAGTPSPASTPPASAGAGADGATPNVGMSPSANMAPATAMKPR